MDIFEAYGMSDEAVEKGIWAELVVGRVKIGRVRVRSTDTDINPEYRRALATAALAAAASGEANEDELTITLLADTVITDWELVTTDKNGKEVPLKYSKKKAVELLRKLPKFRAAVERAANNWTNFRATRFHEAVKS